MSHPPKPLHVRHVAFTFVGAFVLFAFFLTYWYEPAVLLQDSLSRFAWAGTAYLIAYTLTEFVRRPGFFSFVGLSGGLLLLAFDIARHAPLLVQLAPSFGPSFIPAKLWLEFAVCTSPAAGVPTFPCSVVPGMANNPAIVLGLVAGLLVVPMFHKLLAFRASRRQ